MIRFLYFAGFAYIALCGAIVARELSSRAVTVEPGFRPTREIPPPNAPRAFTSGAQWFAAMKQYCNPVEVNVRDRFSPPPATSEGAGYSAACFALAGKIDRARAIIEGIQPSDRASAARVLFDVAHPVADAGDDRASGPMMQLVLEYWPNNYMALYHAGMSEFALGQRMFAVKHLRAFLAMYTVNDGFTQNARRALENLERPNDAGLPQVRPNVERESPAKP